MDWEEKTGESNQNFIPATALMLDQLSKASHHYQQKTAQLETKNDCLETENKCLREQIQLLRSKHFGQSSEKLDPAMQSQLFDEVELDELNPAEKPEEEERIEISFNRRKAKKNRNKYIDTSGLPHERQVMDLADKDKTCACGCELKKIGEDVREEIQCLPERFKVIEHVRPKYACPDCQTVKAAPALMLPLPKSKASSSLLAEIITNKYAYQLPLYRQGKLFEINGLKISDNTLGYLVMRSAELLQPLSDALWAQIPTLKRLQMDETRVKVLKPNASGWMWVYHSYTKTNQFVIFDFNLSRAQVVADNRLNHFSGLLQSDGYIGYENQRKRSDIVSVGCWDHCRRKFMDVIKASGQNKSGKAGQVVKLIAKLYDIETDLKHASYDERYRVRQLKATPILNHLLNFLKKIHAPPKSLLHKAVTYALNQWPTLTVYIEHGDAELSNCWAENVIRPFALGRRNWLFTGNESSAQKAALLHSLVQTCLLNEINPRDYFQYILNQVHRLRKKEVDPESLLPQFIDRKLLKLDSSNATPKAEPVSV